MALKGHSFSCDIHHIHKLHSKWRVINRDAVQHGYTCQFTDTHSRILHEHFHGREQSLMNCKAMYLKQQ